MGPCPVIPVERYNVLRQIDDIDPSFTTIEQLTRIGSVFTKHSQENSFAICLPHRHHEAQEHYIMMHE